MCSFNMFRRELMSRYLDLLNHKQLGFTTSDLTLHTNFCCLSNSIIWRTTVSFNLLQKLTIEKVFRLKLGLKLDETRLWLEIPKPYLLWSSNHWGSKGFGIRGPAVAFFINSSLSLSLNSLSRSSLNSLSLFSRSKCSNSNLNLYSENTLKIYCK